ncbi:DNA-binding response regulator [Halobacteriales archaeon QS_5_70_17]|nr:MAG: DNA-binding response regulator [Halobacteriales archaeon QS_5_70_17]
MLTEVVIADDDETIRTLLEHKLSSQGFATHVEEDGKAARQFLDHPEIDPDAAVLDVMMPRLNGARLLRMVRRGELAVDSDLPIVLLTSRGRESDVLDGLDSGADEYMTKPFSPAELLVRVDRLLDE